MRTRGCLSVIRRNSKHIALLFEVREIRYKINRGDLWNAHSFVAHKLEELFLRNPQMRHEKRSPNVCGFRDEDTIGGKTGLSDIHAHERCQLIKMRIVPRKLGQQELGIGAPRCVEIEERAVFVKNQPLHVQCTCSAPGRA